MRELQAILIGVAYSAVALIIMKLGYDGFKLNFADKHGSTYGILDVYEKAQELDGEVISILVDSSAHVAKVESNSHIYQFYPLNSSGIDVRVMYENTKSIKDTVFGVFQSLTAEYPELILESNDFSNMYIIRHCPDPRKWYWNALLMLVPILFIRAFLQAMYRMLKGVKYDQ